MACNEGHLASAEHFDQLGGVLHFLHPFSERNMLRNIDISICRDVLKEFSDPRDALVSVSVCHLEISVIKDVVQYDHDVFSKMECIVFRSHSESVA